MNPQLDSSQLDKATLDTLWQARYNACDARDLERLLDALARETQDLEARYELDWRRARLFQFQAMQNLENGDSKAARAQFERGAEVSQWTLQQSERGEGRFWHAVNSLEVARLGSKWSQFWALRPARALLQSVLVWDESFHFAGAHRVLGRIAHLAPRNAGGDAAVSQFHFERALQIIDNSTTRWYFAELLNDLGEKAAAQTQIEAILSSPDDENWQWEQERDRFKARKWLENRDA